MAGQAGFFDGDERLKALSAAGDPLERLARVIDFEVFRGDLEAALSRSDRARGGRPPYDQVMLTRLRCMRMRPQAVTRKSRSCSGYVRSGRPQ
jgi:transposase, IS5 family